MNILVFEAGTKRSSGRIATISRPWSSATTMPMRVPGPALASASSTTCPAGAAAISRRDSSRRIMDLPDIERRRSAPEVPTYTAGAILP